VIGVQTASGPATIGAVSIRTAAGDVDIARISMLTSDGDAILFDSAAPGGSLTASVSPSVVYGAGASESDILVQTSATTASAENGTAPFTYSWEQTTGDTAWEIASPLAKSTSFEYFGLAAEVEEQATFTVTITDARGRTDTAVVTANVVNYGGLF